MRKVLLMSLLLSILGGCTAEAIDESSAPYDDEASDESDASTLEGTSTSLTLAARDSQPPVFELDFGGKVAERSAGGVKGSWAGGCGNVAACNQDCNAIVLVCPQTNSEQTCNRRLENCARRCAEMSKCNVIDL